MKPVGTLRYEIVLPRRFNKEDAVPKVKETGASVPVEE
jgi:hypothetical protein